MMQCILRASKCSREKLAVLKGKGREGKEGV